MFSSTRFVAILATCVCSFSKFGEGQVAFNGTCPQVEVVPDFNISSYMGLWYEVAKYPAPFEAGGKCITASYELLENGTVSVVNSQFNIYAKRWISIKGTAVAVDNAQLMVQFPRQPTPTGSNYWVLDTDYTNYSVVLSCSESSADSLTKIIWILTRDRSPPMKTVVKALMVLANNNIPLNHLTVTDQVGCK